MTTICCVGDIITDVLAALQAPLAPESDTPAHIQVAGGGQAANTASWLAASGADVVLVGAIGDDQSGRDRVAELTAAGVRVAAQVCPGSATGAIVVLSTLHGRSMITDRGANLLLTPESVAAGLSDAGRLHLSAYTLLDPGSRRAGRYALDQALARGIAVSVDAASAHPLEQVGPELFFSWVRGTQILLANSDEARVLAGDGTPEEQARRLADAVEGSAVVKLGGRGAVWALPDGETISAPAPEVRTLDTTGAGDAFAAGLIGALAAGASPEKALEAATALGSQAVTTLGARPPVRVPSEVGR
ncbi:MAG: ribokinase [Hamadaea sp.]|uniref:carbohydrate kinase family protein n=1 Tax=Hamadaea sp. TaxID=2024425 RepID=UPI0017B08684|nr:PfkB family carbohydrate kinase [Hamadaea sp.]NUR72509.1 ribokinase [Hamadaea sp.]NUT19689.1 ribokinase [Hamadaea sp.]